MLVYTVQLNSQYISHRGACGEVRLAFDRESSKRFAVKIISKKTFSVGVSYINIVVSLIDIPLLQPQLNRAAMEEVRIIKSMHHVRHNYIAYSSKVTLFTVSFQFKACIIQVKDLFETSDALYIVLELYVKSL